MCSKILGLNHARGNKFVPSVKCPHLVWVSRSLLLSGCMRGSFQRGEAAGNKQEIIISLLGVNAYLCVRAYRCGCGCAGASELVFARV
jgi:hypothetical protein